MLKNRDIFFLTLLLSLCLSLSVKEVKAQSDMVLYQMHRSLFQASYLNPAFISDHRTSVSFLATPFPLFLGNADLSLNTNFNIGNLFRSGKISPSSIANSGKDILKTNLNANVDIFHIKITLTKKVVKECKDCPKDKILKVDNGVLGIGARARVIQNMRMEEDVYRQLVLGEKVMKPLELLNHFDNTWRNLYSEMAFAELSVSYQRFIKVRYGELSVAGRAKILLGLDGGTIQNNRKFDLDFVGAHSAVMRKGKLGYNALGVFGSNDGIGFGLAVDLGVTYRLTENWMFAASLVDIGPVISMSGFYGMPITDSTFVGINQTVFIDNIIKNSKENPASVVEDFWLPGKLILSAEYTLKDKHSFSAVLEFANYGKFYQYPNLALGYNYYYGAGFSFASALSYNTYNNSVKLGVGIAVNIKMWKFFIMTDNIVSAFDPMSNKNWSIRVGHALNFGYTDPIKTQRKYPYIDRDRYGYDRY